MPFVQGNIPISVQLAPASSTEQNEQKTYQLNSENLFSNQRTINPACIMGKRYFNSEKSRLDKLNAYFLL